MPNSDLERLYKIKTHCVNIQKTLANFTLEQFRSADSVDARDVCAFRLFQIGEHVNKLSDDLKKQYPNFRWRAAYRFRNVLGHDYESVGVMAIWRTCRADVQELRKYIEQIIRELETESYKKQESRESKSETPIDNIQQQIAHDRSDDFTSSNKFN